LSVLAAETEESVRSQVAETRNGTLRQAFSFVNRLEAWSRPDRNASGRALRQAARLRDVSVVSFKETTAGASPGVIASGVGRFIQ
jgi:hypothetical protein